MLRRLFGKRADKRGFTLIEILVAIGLLAVVSVAIGSIIFSTQNNTSEMLSDVELQQQIVELQERLHNETLKTNAGIKMWVKASESAPYVQTETTSNGEYEKIIGFYTFDYAEFNLVKTYYRFNDRDNTLETATVVEDVEARKAGEGTFTITTDANIDIALSKIESWALCSSYVDDINFNISNYEKKQLISFDVDVVDEDNTFSTDDTIYVRNEITINKDIIIHDIHADNVRKPSASGLSYMYDGKAHAPTESGFDDRFMYRKEGTTLSATNAGTYKIIYSLRDPAHTQWEDGTKSDIVFTWTISQRTIGLNWGTTTWAYDGSTHSTTCTPTNVVNGDNCQLFLENNLIGPNVGKQICTAIVKNPNYRVPDNHSTELTITKTEPTVTITTTNRTYNTNPQSMVIYSNLVGGNLKFYISTSKTTPANDKVTANDAKATDAGTYYIWYKIVANSQNYQDTDVRYLGSAIMKLSPTATYSVNNRVYTGSTVTGVTGQNVVISGQKSGINVGSYSATVTPATNYAWSNEKTNTVTVTWQITKAAGKIEKAPTAKNLTYTGSAQTLINAGTSSTGTMLYSLSATSGFSTTLPSATNAGDYTVYYYSQGDANHFDTDVQSIKVTIKRASTASYTKKTNLVYNGNAQIGVTGQNVSFTGSVQGTNAGSYTVTVKPTANYLWADTGTDEARPVTWSIAKATPSCTITMNPNYTWDGNTKYPIKTASSSVPGTITFSNGTTTSTTTTGLNNSAVCSWNMSYTFTPTDTTNYKSISSTSLGTWKITRATIAVPTAVNPTYNGSWQWGVSGNHVNWSGTYGATDVGSYTAIATPDGNHCWSDGSTGSKNVPWQMKPATISFTKSNYSGTWDNKAHSGSVTVNSPSGCTITYSTSQSGTYSATKPTRTSAGTTTVYFKIEKANYTTATGSFTITINKATISVPTGQTFTYDGNEKTTKSGSYITWGGTHTATAAGSYTATATPDSNHCWSDGSRDAKDIPWKINKASISYSASGGTWTYNGTARTGTVTVNTSGCTVQYSTDNSSWSTTKPTWTNYPGGTLYYKITKSNYTTVTGSVKIVINRANTATASAASKTYNGSAQTGVSGSNVDWTGTTSATNWKSGGYTAYATPKANYTWSDGSRGTKTITWHINKAAASAWWTNGSNERSFTGGTHSNILSVSGASITSGNSGVNAGTYTVTATCDNNHIWTANNSATYSWNWYIYKIAGSVSTAPSGGTYKYTGSAITLCSAGSGTGTMYYRMHNGSSWSSWSTSRPTATNPGTYTIQYYAAASTNYNQSGTGSITSKIEKQDPVVTSAYFIDGGLRNFTSYFRFLYTMSYNPMNGVTTITCNRPEGYCGCVSYSHRNYMDAYIYVNAGAGEVKWIGLDGIYHGVGYLSKYNGSSQPNTSNHNNGSYTWGLIDNLSSYTTTTTGSSWSFRTDNGSNGNFQSYCSAASSKYGYKMAETTYTINIPKG